MLSARENALRLFELPLTGDVRSIGRSGVSPSPWPDLTLDDDGVEVIAAGHSVLKEMQVAIAEVEADLGITGGPTSREREYDHDRRQGILERIGVEAEQGGFLKTLLYPTGDETLNFGTKGRFDLAATLASSRVWFQLSLHPTDDSPSALATLRKKGPCRLINRLLEWEEHDRLLYYKGKLYISNNRELRAAIMKLCHKTPTTGHSSKHATLKLVTCPLHSSHSPTCPSTAITWPPQELT